MFTGIITHKGRVEAIDKKGDWRVTIGAKNFAQDAAIGASISCGGACLTVIENGSDHFIVQVSGETLGRTTLRDWKVGSEINLERAMKFGDELGGHLVTGHVDGLAELTSLIRAGDSWECRFSAPVELQRYIAAKGSVTINGVSLTVNAVDDDGFKVNIIPHTLIVTTLGRMKVGDKVNLEIDLIARYLERLVRERS